MSGVLILISPQRLLVFIRPINEHTNKEKKNACIYANANTNKGLKNALMQMQLLIQVYKLQHVSPCPMVITKLNCHLF